MLDLQLIAKLNHVLEGLVQMWAHRLHEKKLAKINLLF